MFRAARYIEMNPVRAGIVKNPEDYPWSSAMAYLKWEDDRLAKVVCKRWSKTAADGGRSKGAVLCKQSVGTGMIN